MDCGAWDERGALREFIVILVVGVNGLGATLCLSTGLAIGVLGEVRGGDGAVAAGVSVGASC
jgi:hypothetical protein